VAPSGSSPVELDADDLGHQHVDRLAQHRGLGLDAAHAPAHDAEAVDHRGVAVGADAACRVERPRPRLPRRSQTTLREVLEVDLVARCPSPGGTTRKLLNAPLAPA
jgi:hypothetical protein